VGEIAREDIISNIPGWDEEYYSYAVDEGLIGEIAGLVSDVDIVVVIGTWCSDSHREVPRFWKVLETAGFPAERMKTYGVLSGRAQIDTWTSGDLVDYSKRLKGFYNVTAVESIILYRGGKELGRIIEAPAKSLEADLLEILKK
jgi:hypothetical protein